jgi:hypothetical protein
VDSQKRERLFYALIKRYGWISWICLAGAIGFGGYSVYSNSHIAETLAIVCFVGFFIAPWMPWFKKGKGTLPGVSAEVETRNPLEGDRSPDTEPSEEAGLTVVEPSDDAQNQESAPPQE